jgi:hypothetical protein
MDRLTCWDSRSEIRHPRRSGYNHHPPGLAAGASIFTPQLQIVKDDYPVACAFGGGPLRARIIISTGLRRLLTLEELTALLATRSLISSNATHS